MKKNDDKHIDNEMSAEDLFKAATEDIASEEVIVEKKDTPILSKAILAVLAVVIVGIIFLLGRTLLSRNQEFVDKTKDPEWVEKVDEGIASQGQWDFEYPAEVPKWTKQPFNRGEFLDSEKNVEDMFEWVNEISSIRFATSWMPSGDNYGNEDALVYTNDLSLEYESNGDYNNYFSYVLKEDYLKAYALGAQRLINPVFGEWVFSQMHVDGIPQIDNNNFEVLEDMFSNDWWSTNIKSGTDYSSLPILADWNGDRFSGQEFSEQRTGVYYGVIINKEDNQPVVEEVGKGHQGHSILKITSPVEFAAFGKEGKLVKKGTLVITLAPNTYEYDIINRVVVQSAELIME